MAASPTATVQIGAKQPFGVTNQVEAGEIMVRVTMYARGTNTAMNTGTAVMNIQSAEFTNFEDSSTSKGMAGNTGNLIISDEGLDLRLTVIPEGSTLTTTAGTGALAAASCPPKGAYVRIINAPIMAFGPFAATANPIGAATGPYSDSAGGAFNSFNWQVQKATVRWQADGRWGIDMELKQYVTSNMANPAPPAAITKPTEF